MSIPLRTISHDHQARVPHVTRLKVIATPDGRRNEPCQLQHAPCTILIVGQPPRAFNDLIDVRDSAVAPLMDLVTKDPNPTGPATDDRTFCNAPADRRACRRRAPVRSRSFIRTANFKGRVMEVAGRSVRKARGHRLEDAAVEPNEVVTGA